VDSYDVFTFGRRWLGGEHLGNLWETIDRPVVIYDIKLYVFSILVSLTQVKDRLLFEQKKITAVEERRKQQENRKFSKALKSHKAKEKTEDKKRTLDAVKQWKKDKAHRYVYREEGGRGKSEGNEK